MTRSTTSSTARCSRRAAPALLIVLSFAALLAATAAAPDHPPDPWTRDDAWTRPDDPPPSPGEPVPFLLERTDARAVVSGPVAHTTVRQEWANPNDGPVDGLYIFPLPDNAAVTALRLRIGRRVVEAEMRRREEARALYEQARAEGRVAGLLDQERPNVFAQRVANLMPGERIDVTIEFDHEVHCDGGECSYILPTVVGPRFIPAHQSDPGLIAPPVAAPGAATGHTLTFTLDLDAGVPVRDLRSPTHRMRIETSRHGRAAATLEGDGPGGVRLDRDVEVRWIVGGRNPEFGLLAWRDAADAGEPGVFSLYLVPPFDAGDEALAAPRELVFVLDGSGSMRGAPLEASKEVVRRALRAARPADTLPVLRFSDRAAGLWRVPVPATTANVRRALEYVDGLHGEGGTEMLSGIRAALDRPPDPERLRIVAFLTDGYIGNEAGILGEVRRLIGDARLFSFGIGSSVNRFLLENLAQEGRGAAAFLAPRETPDDMVRRFVDRIATPVFTDIRLSWEGLDVEDLEPAAVPDLFAGQPLVLHGRYTRPGAGAVVVEGRLRGRREVLRRAVTLPVHAADHEALARLWARARVDRLTRETWGRPHADTIAAITRLGLTFSLMTPYTSLVAVDSVVSNHGQAARSVTVPVEMPEGVSYEGIFGDGRGSARPAQWSALPIAPLLAAPPTPKASPRLDRGIVRGSVAAEVDAPGRQDPGSGCARIVLVEADGTRRIVEAGGEAWIVDAAGRRLVRALPAETLRRLRAALDAAAGGPWTTEAAACAPGASCLVVEPPSGPARGLRMPSSAPAARDLAGLVRAATS